MTPQDFEAVYEKLAEALDKVGQDKHALYLAKVVLMLAQHQDSRVPVDMALDLCLEDL